MTEAEAQVDDLTIPRPGSTTVKTLLSRYLSHTLHKLGALPVRRFSPTRAAELDGLRRVLSGRLKSEPGAVMSLMRRPTFSVFVHVIHDVLANEPGPASAYVEALAGELVAQGRIGPPSPFPRMAAGFALALSDNNPLSLVEAHPEKKGNAVDLGGHEVTEWIDVLDQAFALVERYLPELAAEMKLVLHQIVPVGYDAERHLSASYKESVGTIYMSLHPNLMTMTEAFIHEFQHNKVALLFHLDPVLHNAFSPLFKSPVRPDPRPLHGVLLAVHAFQPVAMLYQKMFEAGDPLVVGRPDVVRRYAQVRKLNRDACMELLPNAKPTAAGGPLLAEIARWDEHFAALEADAGRAEGDPPEH